MTSISIGTHRIVQYIWVLGISTPEIIGTHNEWFLMIMMANDIGDGWGPRFHICLIVEEKPQKKPQPGKQTRPGILPSPIRWPKKFNTIIYRNGRFNRHAVIVNGSACTLTEPYVTVLLSLSARKQEINLITQLAHT